MVVGEGLTAPAAGLPSLGGRRVGTLLMRLVIIYDNLFVINGIWLSFCVGRGCCGGCCLVLLPVWWLLLLS